MATLAALVPADGSVLEEGQPIQANVTNATDLDPALLEIVVNGTSFTTANGGLILWNIRKVDTGALVYYYTDVWCQTVGRWVGEPWETVTVDVRYDSASIGGGTYTRLPWAGDVGGTNAGWLGAGLALDLWEGGNLHWLLTATLPLEGAPILHYVVREEEGYSQDAWYWIAHQVRALVAGSALVGERAQTLAAASAVVRAFSRSAALGSVVVQGPFRRLGQASALAGVRFRYGTVASAVVGVETVLRVPASAVVYAVRRGPILEVQIADAGTVADLQALGVTFS